MSDPYKDGGPAFPGSNNVHQAGMTLRDYFAASIIQGLLASGRAPIRNGNPTTLNVDLAAIAYETADVMLEERAR